MRNPTCHPDRTHCAKGLCRSCYTRQWELRHPEDVRRWKKTSRQRHRDKIRIGWRAWREKNKDHMRQYLRDQAQHKRSLVFRLLGDKCTSCGITDGEVLEIDHVNGGGKKDRAGGGSVGYYNRILRHPNPLSKYQLLCANCHIRKTRSSKGVNDGLNLVDRLGDRR